MSMKKLEDLSELAVIGVDIGKDVFHLVGFCNGGPRYRNCIRVQEECAMRGPEPLGQDRFAQREAAGPCDMSDWQLQFAQSGLSIPP